MNTRRILQGIAALVAVGLSGCVLGLVGAWALWFEPARIQSAPITCADGTPEIPRGKRLRMLVWNVQFAGSREHHFFYDGGDAVGVPEATVRETLDEIDAVVKRLDPDIIVWQEIDRGSRRTHRIDELTELLDRTPYACWTDTPYHKAPYVPHPPGDHLGKVDMRLAVFSKYRITKSTRYDLARLDESWARQQFNLKRALLEVEIPIANGGTFVVLDTHLSAYSHGDGTLPRQIATLDERMTAATEAGTPWVLGGDLNSLPPGDDPQRLGDDSALYEAASPLAVLFDHHTSAVPLSEHATDPEPYRTWLPWESPTADRAIDHVFHGPDVDMHAYGVLQDVHDVSDHLPLMFDFAIQ